MQSKVTISVTSKCKIAWDIIKLGLSGKPVYVFIVARPYLDNLVLNSEKVTLLTLVLFLKCKNLKQKVCG